MPQVDVGEAGVETFLKAQFPARIEKLQKLLFNDNLGYTALE
jgi:hypothetical protein